MSIVPAVPAADLAQTRPPLGSYLAMNTSLRPGAERLVFPAFGSKFTVPVNVPETTTFPEATSLLPIVLPVAPCSR